MKDERDSVDWLISFFIEDVWILKLRMQWPGAFMNTARLLKIWLDGNVAERIVHYNPFFESFNFHHIKSEYREWSKYDFPLEFI